MEVVELRFARSDLGFPIHHLVVVLDHSALVGWEGGVGPNHYVYVSIPLCIFGDR
jgi:hypothetical protein